MQKKKLLIVMNCAGAEFVRFFSMSPNITSRYDLHFVGTYLSMDDDAARVSLYEALAEADVVLAQNVQNVEWLRNDRMEQAVKPDCRFFKFAFWRFEGFWPFRANKIANGFWYLPDEIPGATDFASYIGAPVDRAAIRDNFNAELDKFAEIDSASEYRMMPYLLDNFRHSQLFSDSWHPTPVFFFQVVKYVFAQLGIPLDVDVLPATNINRDRYRFIFDAVTQELGLRYDQHILNFNEHLITREVFYEFSRYAADRITTLATVTDAADLFNRWRGELGLGAARDDVARFGAASQSSLSIWSHEGDAQRAIAGLQDNGFAFHTDFDPCPWWQVDLLNIREISEISVWNRAGLHGRCLPLNVSTSLDGMQWQDQATANYEFGSTDEDMPFSIRFLRPKLMRFLKLQTTRPSYLHLGRVATFSNVISWR